MKYLVNIKDINEINKYKSIGIDTFIFPLANYVIGYNEFSVEEINNYPNNYVLINRILRTEELDELKHILPNLNVKGIIFEDLGVYTIVKELGLNIELILFQNHLINNYLTVNYDLDYFDSVVLSNEITLDDIKLILNKSKKNIIVQVFGHNQAMYSRRTLLSNFNENYNFHYQNNLNIKESVSEHEFIINENKYGTVLYNKLPFNGKDIVQLNSDKIKYYFINTMYLEIDDVIYFIKNNDTNLEFDNSFLNEATIYKVRSDKK